MDIIKPKQEEITLVIRGTRSTKLIDRRIRTNGIVFGNVEEVSKNLGITLVDTEDGLMASAPKNRLQLFCEKLHFSGIKFSEV